MSVQLIEVTEEEADLRLDRWFKRRFPTLGHGRLAKLMRKGEVRVDGKRVEGGERLLPGQTVRVPPLGDLDAPPPRPEVSDRDAGMLRRLVIHQDRSVIVLNKPAGLAVQGGSGTMRHLDGMLDALADGGERPKLVHRLDRDTSGVLLLGRTAKATAALARAFQAKETQKVYWAIVAGTPPRHEGTIDMRLAKAAGSGGREHVAHAGEDGQRAVTHFSLIDKAPRGVSWLELLPVTGRTHQLRVHCAEMGTPILGDGKYGGASAFLTGAEVARQLHLHARRIRVPHPDGGTLDVTAELPPHMVATFRYFGFEQGHVR